MSVSRSVYLSHLRRAFLLRVHPDRFRNHSASVRSQQATLVQALSNRLADADFQAWQAHTVTPNNFPHVNLHRSSNQHQHSKAAIANYPFMVERRDGSFVSASLKLSDSVESILDSMAKALEQSG